MKKSRALTFVIVLMIIFSGCIGGENERTVSVDYSIECPLYHSSYHYSAYVGDTYHIYVQLPDSFSEDECYPLVVLLDGDWYFTDSYRIDYCGLAGIVHNLSENDIIPEVILVGIGYDGATERSRDFHQDPSSFYNFLKYELPEILELEHNIHEVSMRSLVGHSSGGFFVLSTMFRGDTFFENYLAVSSPIYTQESVLLSDELSFYNRFRKSELDYRLFLAVGGDEEGRFIESHDDLVGRIRAKEYDVLEMMDRIYYGENHNSVVFDSFLDGLAWLFSDIEDVNINRYVLPQK